jgi:hypothetical protein
MVDDETGVDAVARDGETGGEGLSQRAKDQLAARREARESGSAGRPVDAQPDEGEEAELFPMGTLKGDPKITLKNLVKGGQSIEYQASVRSASVPLLGGLVHPDEDGHATVAWETEKFELVPVRKGEPGNRRIVSWKLRQIFRPTHIEAVAEEGEVAGTG